MGARDLFDLSGKVALVAGGSRGIGLAVAEGLASAGAKVVVANSTPDQGERAAAQIRAQGHDALAIPFDIRQRASIDALVVATLKACGRIDILVNAIGVIRRGPIEAVTEDDWDTMMGVNLRGAFLLCQAVGREMITKRHGKIVNISSNVSQVLQPHRGAYAVTKAGMSHLTRVLGPGVGAPRDQRQRHRAGADHHRSQPQVLRGQSQGPGGAEAVHPAGPTRRARRLRGGGHLPGIPGLGLRHGADLLRGWRLEPDIAGR